MDADKDGRVPPMDILDQLEQRLDVLLRRVAELENENAELQIQLEEEKTNREAVRERIDRLLARLTGGTETDG